MSAHQAASATNQNTMARQGSSGGLRKLELNSKYDSVHLNLSSVAGGNTISNPASSGLAGPQGNNAYTRAGNTLSGPIQADNLDRMGPTNYLARKPSDNMNSVVGSGLTK